MIAGDALVRGGRLDVGAERRDGEIELVIRAEGPRILLDPMLRETLAKGGSRRRRRAPRRRRLAGAQPGGRSGRNDPAVSDPADEVLMIGVAPAAQPRLTATGITAH